MKKHILFLMLFCCSILFAQKTSQDLIGKWSGTDERNMSAEIDFMANGKIKLSFLGQDFPEADYQVNYNTNPLSMSISINKNGKKFKIFGLIKFLDDNSLKWELFPVATKQPLVFSKTSTGNSVILKRS